MVIKKQCDLNCDMGEESGNDERIMSFISSANIACGYHAGSDATMYKTIRLALQYGVAIGAHPSFNDRANFGRTEMYLSQSEVFNLVTQQLQTLQQVIDDCGAVLHHVKPHGALYNMAANDRLLAQTIALAVYKHNPNLIMYGLSGSWLLHEAVAQGLPVAAEVFADRTYQDDGRLTPRNLPNALITDHHVSVKQVLQMIEQQEVTTLTGKTIPMVADTICLHGDGAHAADFADKIYNELRKRQIVITAPKLSMFL